MTNRKRQWLITENNYNIDDFNNAIEKIASNKNNYYAYAFHDDDTKHYHLVVCYENPRTFDAIKKAFPRSHIEPLIDLSKSIQYLTHKNDEDKIKYDFDIIVSNDKNKTMSLYNDEYNNVFVDNDSELYKDLKSGLCLDDLIKLEKYSIRYLNQRLNMIKEIESFYYKKRINDSAYKRIIDNLYYDDLIPLSADDMKSLTYNRDYDFKYK